MTSSTKSAERRLEGSVVESAYENMWPFNRAVLLVSCDELRFARAPRRIGTDLRVARGDGPVRLVRYRAIPLMFRDVLWLSDDPRVGFLPWRTRRLRRALVELGWGVEVETRWWWVVRRKLG